MDLSKTFRRIIFFWLVLPSLTLFATPYVGANGYNDCNSVTNGEDNCLSQHLNEKTSVIFDVGANAGGWTAMALKHAPKAKVYAFEPHPKVFALLEKKCSNQNVECVQCGLSEQPGEATLYVWGADSDVGKSRLNGLHFRPLLRHMLQRNPKKVQVSLTTLDQFCAQQGINHIDYLKIDTEGNEYNVILGAEQMIISHQIDAIQFEYGGCYKDSRTTLETVYQCLTDNSFEVYRILPKGLLHISAWDPKLENYQYSNYLAILKK